MHKRPRALISWFPHCLAKQCPLLSRWHSSYHAFSSLSLLSHSPNCILVQLLRSLEPCLTLLIDNSVGAQKRSQTAQRL